MNQALQIIGSVASIVSIPLAVFVFLRQKEAQYRRLRQEIAKTLSYKIGEDSSITLFEVNSVIESKARDFGVPSRLIPADGVIEDLVADTISNPMLDKVRKSRVVENLQHLHAAGLTLRILHSHAIPLSRALAEASTNIDISPEDRAGLQNAEKIGSQSLAVKVDKLSTTFGILSFVFVAIGIVLVEVNRVSGIFLELRAKPEFLSLILGILSSLVAGLVATGISFFKRHLDKRKMEQARWRSVRKPDSK